MPLTWLPRMALILGGASALALLVLASTLRPEERGFGTHRQLGLSPCSVRVLWGVRCPACGMTTSWAFATQGDLLAAMRTNSGGVALAAVALLGGFGALVSGVFGRWPKAVTDWRLLQVMLVVMAIILTDWMIKLAGS